MIFALKDGNRVAPEATGERASCPGCGLEVLSKCGEMNAWHWAHIAGEDCDPWSEGETEWHLGWKGKVPKEWTEITIRNGSSWHRADIQKPNGVVIELQHSSLSIGDIRDREAFYGEMLWLWDVSEAFTSHRLSVYSHWNAGLAHFRWSHSKRTLSMVAKPIMLDLGDNRLLSMKELDLSYSPPRGHGILYPYNYFERWLQR